MIFTRRKLFCFKIYLLERAAGWGGWGAEVKNPHSDSLLSTGPAWALIPGPMRS